MNLEELDTEQVNEKTLSIDEMDTLTMLKTINSEDQKVALAVRDVLPSIGKAVDCIYRQMQLGGRLIYLGAGTSGRLGVLDASECPPTYGVEPTLVQGLIAGGYEALTTAIEGAEDSKKMAIQDLKKIKLTSKDVVCGIAASGRTPYVIGGLEYAREMNCPTISICCVKNGEVSLYADYPIEAIVGPEVVTGSTRMKAGTAQKMILNMLSTASMIKLGKVYGNLMVDVQPTNEKLKNRAVNIVSKALNLSKEESRELLNETDFNVKIAILKHETKKNVDECKKLLKENNNNISATIKMIKRMNKECDDM